MDRGRGRERRVTASDAVEKAESSEEVDDDRDSDYNENNNEVESVPSLSDDEILEGKTKSDGQPAFQWSRAQTGSFENIFTEISGLTNEVQNCRSLLDFFRFFINIFMIEHIVLNTNKRIVMNCAKSVNMNYLNYPLTVIEFQCFMGLLLLFGVLRKNKIEISEIWATVNKSIHNVQHATAAMSRDRFKLIMRSLVFDDLSTRNTR